MKNIVVQKRDRSILHFLFKNKVATLNQIKEALGLNSSRQMISRRLNKLCSAQYLEKAHLGQTACYGLHEKGYDDIVAKEIKRTHSSGLFKLDPKKIKHDTLLCDIYQKLETSAVVRKLLTHNEVVFQEGNKFNQRKIADALFWVKDICLALELELSSKDIARYQMLLTQYYSNDSIDGVLYLTQGQYLKKHLHEIDRKIFGFAKRKIFVGSLEQFLKAPEQTPFYASDNSAVVLDKI